MTVKSDHPDSIGKYEVKDILGQGAMGIVYKAFDPFIKRKVALKLIHKDLMLSESGDEVSIRFKLEAQAAGRFSPHNNIVTVYEFGEEDGAPFIVMEYVEGKTLKQWMEEGTDFSLKNICSIMNQLLNGLHYSHSHNVVHRDIKPENLFLLNNGQIKISDFGIAKIDQTGVTQQGIRIGTPSYMSPEQIEGKTVDGRSDLFSAGVIFYQLLTGQKPFSGDSIASLMHQVVNTEPAPVGQYNKSIPKVFDSVIQKALAKNPDERFQTGQEFALALHAAMDGKSVQSGNGIKKSSMPLLLGGVGVATLLLIGGVFFFVGGDKTEPPKQAVQKAQETPQVQPAGEQVAKVVEREIIPEQASTTEPSSAVIDQIPESTGLSEKETSLASNMLPTDLPGSKQEESMPSSLEMVKQESKQQDIEKDSVSPLEEESSLRLARLPQEEEISHKAAERLILTPEELIKDSIPEKEQSQKDSSSITPAIVSFESRGYYTSSSGVLSELVSGDTLTPSDNYYLTYQSDQDLYLYIAQIDSQGYIYPIFPNSEFSPQFNPVPKGNEHKFPEDSELYLDFNVGKERIYFIVRKERLRSLELMFEEIKLADNRTKKKLAENFVEIFNTMDPSNTKSLWFWHN